MKDAAALVVVSFLAFAGSLVGSYLGMRVLTEVVMAERSAATRAESAERSLASITAERDQLRREKAERVAAQAKVGKK